jgi:hypothetical protein
MLAKWDGNRNGFYELPLTLGERGIRRAWFDAITQDLEDHWASLEVDGLLKLKQQAEIDKENL